MVHFSSIRLGLIAAALTAMTAVTCQAQADAGLTLDDHILAADGSAKLLKAPAHWSPSRSDAELAKAAVYQWLSSNPRPRLPVVTSSAPTSLDPNKYAFQYIGIFGSEADGRSNATGDRIVLMHGSINGHLGCDGYIDKSEMNIMDGGDNFFDASFDVDTKRLIYFHIHGLA